MANINILEINLGDFLKSVWTGVKKSVKKLWFKINFKSVNFGFDNVYQKRIFGKEKESYCFVCGDKGKATLLSHVVGYCEWDHKCDICKRNVNVCKKPKVDYQRR